MATFNYIDIILAAVFLLHLVQGVRVGLWPLVARFVALTASLVLALRAYPLIGPLIADAIGAHILLSHAIGFVGLFIVLQILLFSLIRYAFSYLPPSWWEAPVSRFLALIPASVDSLILVSLIVFVVLVFPLSTSLRNDVNASVIGGEIVEALPKVEHILRSVLGDSLDEALTYITVRPGTAESVEIPYRPRTLEIDVEAEIRMLELVNQERARAGAPPLVMDETIVVAARAHSRDMWERGYFSHTNPDGLDAFDRMRNEGARFVLAGENIAFAPTVGVAHRGLMNSPGHRRNILDARFTRIGIGVVDGGIYGKMYTQNFAN